VKVAIFSPATKNHLPESIIQIYLHAKTFNTTSPALKVPIVYLIAQISLFLPSSSMKRRFVCSAVKPSLKELIDDEFTVSIISIKIGGESASKMKLQINLNQIINTKLLLQ